VTDIVPALTRTLDMLLRLKPAIHIDVIAALSELKFQIEREKQAAALNADRWRASYHGGAVE
jgi:hypothetical protein